MRILLVGHGRMGRLVASLAGEYGAEIAGILDSRSAAGPDGVLSARWRDIDVAIDFSSPSAVPVNVPALAKHGIALVVGTTGWQAHEAEVRQAVAAAHVGIVAASNFSAGVVMFEAVVARAAKLMASREEYGAWIHEAHHAAKKDAPSGTALTLKRAMEGAGYSRSIDVSSTRAGHMPGTHTVGFDGAVDTISLTHTARDRTGFARGALIAAQWIRGRAGWYTMADVLGITG